MPQYRLTAQAEADLDGIWYFIARDNIQAANSLIDTLLERFSVLTENPMMGRPRPNLGPDLRSIPIGNHLSQCIRLVPAGQVPPARSGAVVRRTKSSTPHYTA